MVGRILALDFGEKRIGVALSDPLGYTAQAQAYIPNTPQLFQTLKALIVEKSVTQIIVGLPLTLKGTDSTKTQEVRAFTAHLKTEFPDLPIALVDERLSTKAAQRQLSDAGMSQKKQRHIIDSQAAQFFLQGYLDSR